MKRGWERLLQPKQSAKKDWSSKESGAERAHSRTWRRDDVFGFSGTNICIHARDYGEGGRTSVVLPPQKVKIFLGFEKLPAVPGVFGGNDCHGMFCVLFFWELSSN